MPKDDRAPLPAPEVLEAERPRFGYLFAREKGLVVLECGDHARVGMRPDADATALIEARRFLGRPLVLAKLDAAEFERALAQSYALDGIQTGALEDAFEGAGDLHSLLDGMPETADLLDASDDAPVIRLLNGLIAEAARRRASDIHLEPFEKRLSVRLRIDGVMQEVLSLPQRLAPALVSRVKVMARLDISERRLPQDGRISLALGGRSLDVRVATLPARHGERVVLRLLDKEQAQLDLDQLGMDPAMLARFREGLAEPNGIILVTGPTGSGKTTTLYAALTLLNDSSRNILTVEDPIEYAVEGIGQTQVNPRVGLTFAAGLRAILRQDPDVVMVGEIRDLETAQIAVQASLTGHLVLSTVHTNDAVSAITRLRDMGVPSFLLASTMRLVLAQRLVRRLCPACKQPAPPEPGLADLLGRKGQAIPLGWTAVGCEACGHTGYAGRIGLYELVRVEDDLRRLIHDDAGEHELARVAHGGDRAGGRLLDAGLELVAQGRTTLAEVMRVARTSTSRDGDSDGGL